jgi:hypothetical protein
MEEKKTSTKAKIAIGVGALVVLGSLGGKGGSKGKPADGSAPASAATAPSNGAAAAPSSAPAAAPAPTAAKAAAPEPAFVTQRAEACKRYEAASNDIKKSAVYSELEKAAEGAGHRAEAFEGTIEEIKTPSAGGDSVLVKVRTPWGTFGNNDIFQGHKRGTKKGSAVYNALGELEEGAKVRVSASMIVPEKGFIEKNAVCGDDWLAKFDKIEKAN